MMTGRVTLAVAALMFVAVTSASPVAGGHDGVKVHEHDLELVVNACAASLDTDDCLCVCVGDECKCECPVQGDDDVILGHNVSASTDCIQGGTKAVGERKKRAAVGSCHIDYAIYVNRKTGRYVIVYWLHEC